MKHFYAINIQNNYATVLFVKKNKHSFYIIEHQTLELSEASSFLQDKKSFYVAVEQNEVVEEKISIEQVIKSDNVIKHFILKKLHDANIKNKILFNYYALPQSPNDEKITYQVDGVHEEEYLKALKTIGDFGEIKSATINKFALFGISQECIKEKSFFSIHTQANKITTIAVHENGLIFSRSNTIVADTAQTRQANLVEEITQTISYVQQHFREIDFLVVALSGSIAVDDIITDHIHMSSGLGITVLYPNTFIHGFEGEEAQHYMFSLGSFFVPKRSQFIPTSILALQQYALSLKTVLAASLVAVFVSSFFAYEKFYSYQESLQKYETVKSTLDKIARNTKTHSNEDLERSLTYLQMAEKYLQHHPLDTISLLKPLARLQKPQELKWEYADENLKLYANFQCSFKTLNELYHFEKLFKNRFEDINTTFKKEYVTKTDYKKLDFETTIIIQNTKEAKTNTATRRRRR